MSRPAVDAGSSRGGVALLERTDDAAGLTQAWRGIWSVLHWADPLTPVCIEVLIERCGPISPNTPPDAIVDAWRTAQTNGDTDPALFVKTFVGEALRTSPRTPARHRPGNDMYGMPYWASQWWRLTSS